MNKKKILLVDDERFILLTVSSCLASANYEVEQCSSVKEAMEKFEEGVFDLIISDIAMVPLDGLYLRSFIRGIDHRIPFLFLTSMFVGSNGALFEKINGDDYSYVCSKNFVRDDFLKRVKSTIGKYSDYKESLSFKKTISDNLAMAEKIQRILIPNSVHVTDDCYYNYIYRPAYHVSGDVFKWIELKDSRYIGVFGDISGHGVQAALVMSSIQALLANEHVLANATPDTILQYLHDFFCQGLTGSFYMTCLITIWDFKANKLCFQSAGHPDLLCFNSVSGEEKLLNPDNIGNMPVGLMADTKFTAKDNIELTFDDNDIFFAYTDGLFDLASSTNSKQELDIEFFKETAKLAIQQNTLLGVPQQIVDACNKIGLDEQSDDLLLLTLKKKSPNEHIFTNNDVTVDYHFVDDLCTKISNFVLKNFNDLTLSFCVEIILSEFLTNIVKHGIEKNKLYIAVVVDLTAKDFIKLEVYDNSKSWNSDSLNYAELDDIFNKLSDDLQTGGRGIPIMHSISPNISTVSYCGLNKTTFMVDCNIAKQLENKGVL